jgi:hypothetical protein
MKPRERAALSLPTKVAVLTEPSYRCAVPTCRQILALDLHHMWEVSGGGGDEISNLIALCPTCYRLYHRGDIKSESIYLYKSILVALNNAFDVEAIDRLMFLHSLTKDVLIISGDGVLQFSRLIAAGFAEFQQKANNNFQIVTYAINISAKGQQLIEAWRRGNRTEVSKLVGAPKSKSMTKKVSKPKKK